MNRLFIIAGKEFTDGLRNRWVFSITVIFSVLSVGLAYFGAAASGQLGFFSLDSTIISLASLAVVLIPLIALMLSYSAFVGEYEQGTMLLLLTYPLSRAQLLTGKFIGQGAILAVSSIAGFGFSALVIVVAGSAETADVFSVFGGFIVSAILLGWSFIAMAYVVSVFVTEKSKAAGLVLFVWFLFVVVYDLLLMVLLVVSEGNIHPQLLPILLYLNPTDVFRLINYLVIGADQYGGVLQLAQHSQMPLMGLFGVLVIWILAPLTLAWSLFKRRVL